VPVPSTSRLWPPNHKLKAVSVGGVTDPDGDPVTVTVTGVTQDEPLDDKGDGRTCPDAVLSGGDEAMLRAERTGLGDGRIYHLAFEAADDRGGTCTGVITVCVPHDQSKKKVQCVDQGPLFDATGSCPPGAGAGKGKSKNN
jgi:hypothetical protein